MVPVTIFDTHITAIIDTAAQVTIVNTNIVKDIKVPHEDVIQLNLADSNCNIMAKPLKNVNIT